MRCTPISCSLLSHAKGYQLSPCEALYSPLVSPFAFRHLGLANSPKMSCVQRWGHRFIAVIQMIPIIGILASLIERIVVLAAQCFCRSPEIVKDPSKLKLSLPKSGSNTISVIPEPLPETEEAKSAQLLRSASRRVVREALTAKIRLISFCREVPGSEKVMKEIAHLDISQQAEKIKKWISTDPTIAALTELNLDKKKLKGVPPEIKFFKKLKTLKLSNNDLETLPDEIGELKHLQSLILLRNQFKKFPTAVGRVAQLQLLSLDHNFITAIGPEIGNLTQLKQLYLHNNSLVTLPDEIGKLRGLHTITLHKNNLSRVPPSMGKLIALNTLNLEDNELEDIPSEVCRLPQLKDFALGNNKFSKTPRALKDVNLDCKFDLTGNPLGDVKSITLLLQKHPGFTYNPPSDTLS